MSEEVKPAAPEDPFDLGDTDLQLQASTPTPPEKAAPPKDPVTGRFVSPAAEPAPAEPAHPSWLVEQARDFGYTDEEIAATPTNNLGIAVRRLQLSQRQYQSQADSQRSLEGVVVRQDRAAPPAPETDELAELGELAGELDPKLAGFLRKLARENKSLKAQVGQVGADVARRDHETRSAWIDRVLGELGDESLLGAGAVRDLKADSAEFARRTAVVNEAIRIAGTNATPEQWIPKIGQALGRLGFAKKKAEPKPEPKPEKVNGRVSAEEWEDAALARPTQRSGSPEPKGDKRAVENLTRKMRDSGMLGDDAEITDGLLG